ncbi:MAG: HD domain-containing protein [Patescibacteria group bacterium]|nr:HD domain-containing protein [Patescibacteria group bacterium]
MPRLSDLLGPSPYQGQQPENEALNDSTKPRPDYTRTAPKPADIHRFVVTPLFAFVGDAGASDEDLLAQLGWDANQPHGSGTLELAYRWDALWKLEQSNMALNQVEKALKKYTKDQGWNWQGLSLPNGDMFGKTAALERLADVPGIGEINPGLKNWRYDDWADMETHDSADPNHPSDYPGYSDPKDGNQTPEDEGIYTCSECGRPCQDQNEFRMHVLREHVHEREPSQDGHGFSLPRPGDPTVDHDDALPAHWDKTHSDTAGQTVASWRIAMGLRGDLPENISFTVDEPNDDHPGLIWLSARLEGRRVGYLSWVEATGEIMDIDVLPEYQRLGIATAMLKEAHRLGYRVFHSEQLTSDGFAWAEATNWASPWRLSVEQQIPGPIPMIYDIEQDRVYVGHPGERHSDIVGRFTPGGIVEGQYDPKGNLQIRTDTDMPWTVRHLAELWYYTHPELEIKAIYLMRGEDKHKLASTNIGNRVRNLLATDAAAYDAVRALQQYGKVYVVGGAVRDIVLGKAPRDFDLMVTGIPLEDAEEILSRLPGKVDVTGKSFGVLRYRNPEGEEVEVALPRKDFHLEEGGHKDVDVHHDPFMNVEEDLGRRDFTANAMAVDMSTGELIDPYHGAEDIKRGQLEPVSDDAFAQDPLRILRTLSAISKHQLIPSRHLLEMIKDNAYRLKYLPQERVQAEMDKMLSGGDAALAIELLEDTGVFGVFLPEYDRTRGFDQRNKYHNHKLHDHLKNVLREVSKQTDDTDVRWAALLHDIGKPHSQWLDPDTGEGHYYKNAHGHGDDHWEVGANMAKELLTRMKFPNQRTDRITHLIRHHMFPRFDTEKGARKFLNRVGDEHADDLLRLRRADIEGRSRRHDDVGMMESLVNQVRQSQQPTQRSQLAIDGHTLIQQGFQPGPQMGKLLEYLTQQVIENPELNTPETLLQMATDSWDDSKTANILDPVQRTLDATVFNAPQSTEPSVKPGIIKFVKKVIYSAMTEAGWPDPRDYLNLILTGSLTTYQYSEHSDFDISLWIDAERLPTWVRADLIALMIEKCDGTVVPGTTHPMQCFVVDIARNTREQIYQPGLRSAYDLDAKVWIVPPEHREIDVNVVYRGAVAYAKTVVDKVKLMLAYDKPALKQYWHFLHKNRMRDMRAGKGDFSESNIVYKALSNEGLLPLISEATGEYIA